MREQQDLQAQHANQIQSLRQQLDAQASLNQAQDWQMVGGLAGALLMALAVAWLLTRWPMWRHAWAEWRSAAAIKPRADLKEHNLAAFQASSLGGGSQVDHSGPGMLAHLMRKRKIRRNLKAPDVHSGWLAQLDEPDSQMLADDALREYELRKTVGLSTREDEAPAKKPSPAQPPHESFEALWRTLQEVPLEQATEQEVVRVDVSTEVQRVRKTLQQRRQERVLGQIAGCSKSEGGQEEAAGIDFVLPVHSATDHAATQAACIEPFSAEPAKVASLSQPVIDLQDEPASKLAQPEPEPEPCFIEAVVDASPDPACAPDEELALSYVQEIADTFSPSVRAMSDAETRLALAQEFEKLGQLDEAAVLCEEVLTIGTVAEQFRARQYLSSLPGR